MGQIFTLSILMLLQLCSVGGFTWLEVLVPCVGSVVFRPNKTPMGHKLMPMAGGSPGVLVVVQLGEHPWADAWAASAWKPLAGLHLTVLWDGLAGSVLGLSGVSKLRQRTQCASNPHSHQDFVVWPEPYCPGDLAHA